jgi:hypothetical protein
MALLDCDPQSENEQSHETTLLGHASIIEARAVWKLKANVLQEFELHDAASDVR